ncbi:MAG: hypothetical protein HY423_01470 [Candidatus Lambdaproteobacteria bacterium]|nr:hypothetical protein [Candidatus Lambdaproteobacteria bacterium]
MDVGQFFFSFWQGIIALLALLVSCWAVWTAHRADVRAATSAKREVYWPLYAEVLRLLLELNSAGDASAVHALWIRARNLEEFHKPVIEQEVIHFFTELSGDLREYERSLKSLSGTVSDRDSAVTKRDVLWARLMAHHNKLRDVFGRLIRLS